MRILTLSHKIQFKLQFQITKLQFSSLQTNQFKFNRKCHLKFKISPSISGLYFFLLKNQNYGNIVDVNSSIFFVIKY